MCGAHNQRGCRRHRRDCSLPVMPACRAPSPPPIKTTSAPGRHRLGPVRRRQDGDSRRLRSLLRNHLRQPVERDERRPAVHVRHVGPRGNLTNPTEIYRRRSPFPYRFDPANPRFIFPHYGQRVCSRFALPYTHQINAAVQRQLARDVSLTVAYVSSLGHHLLLTETSIIRVWVCRILRRPSTPGEESRERCSGPSGSRRYSQHAYHGLQVTGEKRFSNNISFKGFYTFGKGWRMRICRTICAGGAGSGQYQTRPGQNQYDRTHNFVLSGIWN